MAIPAWRVKLSSRPESQKIKSLAHFKKLQDIWVNNDDIS
jgi:hypothetical protein